jgi:hypothetical protein
MGLTMRRKTAVVLALILAVAVSVAVVYAHQNGVVIVKKKDRGPIFGRAEIPVRVNLTGLEDAPEYTARVSIVNVETGEPFHVKCESTGSDYYIMDQPISNTATTVKIGYEGCKIEEGTYKMWFTAEGYTVTPESVEFTLPDYFLDTPFEVFHFHFQKAS